MTLVLEYMDGGSVADLLARVGRIAEFYLADIARQVRHWPGASGQQDCTPSRAGRIS